MEKILPVNEMLLDLVINGVVTMEEMKEISSSEEMKKSRKLLSLIWRSTSGGYPNSFIKILCIMQHLQKENCVALSREIYGHLDIFSDVIKTFTADLMSK